MVHIKYYFEVSNAILFCTSFSESMCDLLFNNTRIPVDTPSRTSHNESSTVSVEKNLPICENFANERGTEDLNFSTV